MLSIRDYSRREWLRIAGISAAGLSLAQPKPGFASTDRSFGKAKACIFLFLGGGPPQHETWDPKPDAPLEIRGDLKPIRSKTPGLQVGELMPMVAGLTDRISVLRATVTRDNAHSSSGYWMLTGHPHIPMQMESAKPGAPNDSPSFPSIIRYLKKDAGRIPSSVILPEHIRNNPNVPWPGQFAGWLGRASDPWLLTCDPRQAGFNIPELGLPGDVAPLRFDDRRSLLSQMNSHLNSLDAEASVGKHTIYQEQALNLMTSPKARRAFDLSHESSTVRDRFGRTHFGQSCLLARRLIEACVTMVQVNWPREKDSENAGNPLWDTHQKNAERLKTVLMPDMDRAYSALIEDLEQRGLLDSTLIVWAGEFGRTPRINGAGGRDHWGSVFSTAFCGGGSKKGVVYGSSDAIGSQPRDGAVYPQDLHATMLHLLGYSSDTELRDVQGRVIPVCRGDVIRAIV